MECPNCGNTVLPEESKCPKCEPKITKGICDVGNNNLDADDTPISGACGQQEVSSLSLEHERPLAASSATVAPNPDHCPGSVDHDNPTNFQGDALLEQGRLKITITSKTKPLDSKEAARHKVRLDQSSPQLPIKGPTMHLPRLERSEKEEEEEEEEEEVNGRKIIVTAFPAISDATLRKAEARTSTAICNETTAIEGSKEQPAHQQMIMDNNDSQQQVSSLQHQQQQQSLLPGKHQDDSHQKKPPPKEECFLRQDLSLQQQQQQQQQQQMPILEQQEYHHHQQRHTLHDHQRQVPLDQHQQHMPSEQHQQQQQQQKMLTVEQQEYHLLQQHLHEQQDKQQQGQLLQRRQHQQQLPPVGQQQQQELTGYLYQQQPSSQRQILTSKQLEYPQSQQLQTLQYQQQEGPLLQQQQQQQQQQYQLQLPSTGQQRHQYFGDQNEQMPPSNEQQKQQQLGHLLQSHLWQIQQQQHHQQQLPSTSHEQQQHLGDQYQLLPSPNDIQQFQQMWHWLQQQMLLLQQQLPYLQQEQQRHYHQEVLPQYSPYDNHQRLLPQEQHPSTSWQRQDGNQQSSPAKEQQPQQQQHQRYFQPQQLLQEQQQKHLNQNQLRSEQHQVAPHPVQGHHQGYNKEAYHSTAQAFQEQDSAKFEQGNRDMHTEPRSGRCPVDETHTKLGDVVSPSQRNETSAKQPPRDHHVLYPSQTKEPSTEDPPGYNHVSSPSQTTETSAEHLPVDENIPSPQTKESSAVHPPGDNHLSSPSQTTEPSAEHLPGENHVSSPQTTESVKKPSGDNHVLSTSQANEPSAEHPSGDNYASSTSHTKTPSAEHPPGDNYVSSPSQTKELFPEHPPGDNLYEGDPEGPVEPAGHWYQKKDGESHNKTGSQKSHKEKKKGTNKGGHLSLGASHIPISLKQVEPEKGVTVVFHVLLVSNFKMEEEHLHIRAGGKDLGDFDINCVDFSLVRTIRDKDKKKLMYFSGQCTLTINRAREGTRYKYVVIKKGEVFWEQLVEFQSRYRGVIVDRFLYIPDKCLNPGEQWNQYDAVSYIYGEKNLWERFKDQFRSEETAADRTTALLTFMPKWKGFFNGSGEDMTATDAVVELHEVVSGSTNAYVIGEHDSVPKLKKPPYFNISKILSDLLESKVLENASILSNGKTDLDARASALVSSLVIVMLLEKYNLTLERDIKLSLLKCLALEVDPTSKKCTAYEVVLKEFSDGLRACAAGSIEQLCNDIMAQADGQWLFAIPLLHFLRGDSKTFEEPDITGSYNRPEWFGAKKLRIKEFQRSEKQNVSAMLPQLASAFELDRLLKRTFLHAIPVWELHKIVPSNLFNVCDVCVALVTFCSREHVRGNSKWMNIGSCVKSMISQLEDRERAVDTSVDKLEFTTSVCLRLLETCFEELTLREHLELICLLIKLLLTSIQRQRIETTRLPDDTEYQEQLVKETEIIQKLLKTLRTKLTTEFSSTMSNYYQSEFLLRELSIWSELLWVADENQGFDAYRQFLTEELENRARKVEGKYLVEIFCEVEMDAFEKAVGESFTKLAFEAVDKIINSRKKGDADKAFRTLRSTSTREEPSKAGKSGELLSLLLTKSWPRGGGAEEAGLDPGTVEFLLTWNAMIGYLKFFGDESGRGGILSPEGQETLSMAKSLLEALAKAILDASVTVEILLLLKKYQQRFLELLTTSSPVADEGGGVKMPTKDETEQSLTDRIEELEKFQAVQEKVLTFTRMCDLIQPVSITQTKKKATQNVSVMPISNLCERKGNKQIDVKFFEIVTTTEDVLSLLHKVQESLTFQELWIKFGNKAQTARKNEEAKRRDLSISNVVDRVWKQAYEAWQQLAVGLTDGKLTLGDVDKFFESYKNRKEDLMREVSRIFDLSPNRSSGNISQPTNNAAQCVLQIQQYHRLHQYASAAGKIWEFKESMGFTGDFKVIEDLRDQLSSEFKQKPLNSIGRRFAEAGQALECLDVDKAECFRAVVESRPLVEWLRSTITSTQELKVLVDLALISAGESDPETDRISSFHTSCLGFAPLIFDLKESQNQKVNFEDLMEACKPVWKAVEADQRLPQKLIETNLKWLKTVKESHGSVAMTSLVQAKLINSTGVYVVGHLVLDQGSKTEHERSPDRGSKTVLERRLSLDDVISLKVQRKHEGEDVQSKTYSLNELKDLQSKLMLIAGKAEKGKDEVETFVRNLEGIMRLANAYMKLSETGFVHRMHWSQEFHCSKDKREGESIAEELAAASTTLEECYSVWQKKVSNARKDYQELNFFTTQQLMLLRKEIAAVCRSSQLHVDNFQVLTLLESVRPSLNSENLKVAIQRAFKDTDLLDQTGGMSVHPFFTLTPRQGDFDTHESLYKNSKFTGKRPLTVEPMSQVHATPLKKATTKGISKIRRFLNAAEEEGYSEQIAVSALASLGVDADEDDLLLWCLEESDDADLESLYEEAMRNPVIERELCTEGTCDGQLKKNSEIIDESDRLSEFSSEFPQSSVEQKGSKDEDNEAEISEYLTLAQLGSILRELALKDKRTKPRTFPDFLKRGRPNLMLVPKGDVLATVLALYMHDKQQPLPSQEEVLICTPETTTEEIELLWRRSAGDSAGRFYCLVNADQLDFTVSKQAVELLSVVTQGLAGKTGEHYGLVVICSSENEDRANIVAALDQYRVAAPPCPSPDDLQNYLKRQFRIPPQQYGYINNSKITWVPAGSLDPEKLCVRVVSSSRGGLGKTLFVRRLTDKLPNLVNNDMVLSQLSNVSLHVTVPLHGNSTDSSMLVDLLLPHGVKASVPVSRIFHLDVSPSMRRGLDTLLFNLLVLGSLCDKMGRMWRRRSTDLYLIEITTDMPLPTGLSREEEAELKERQSGSSKMSKRPFHELLPTVSCVTPRTVLGRLAVKPDGNSFNPLLDVDEFRSVHFQRVYQYLKLSEEGNNMENFTFVSDKIDEDQQTCLKLLLSNCGIPDPSWSEIRHFVSFLNSQLEDCEQSIFCDSKLMRNILKGPNVLNLEGFRSFVVRFMIQMSRDFATPSLTEEKKVFFTKDDEELERKEIEQFTFRRRWESSPHPYLFFNQDHITMTFLGFYINSAGDLVDPQTNRTLKKGLMSKQLRTGLQAQRVDFSANTDNWKRAEKIQKLCSVMGVQWINGDPNFDPDRAYELTTDNVKKIMAIHMRFRCNIPVIVMGETGCGKTRLIRYMCGLLAGPKDSEKKSTPNMLLVKVHGGTTHEDIELKVKQAEKMARENQDKNIDTVLFFDEANTTEALSMIKEVMVDRRIRGKPVGQGLKRLQFIAACNPYRRHTDDMIHKLESAGLGYHVKTEESDDRLGHIPLRHLVYRVHALPGSMRPLIWDFGQLNEDVEGLYINQIVTRFILRERQLPGDSATVQAVAAVLAASQKYMRDQSDECSFVSLRDVERAMQVMIWFYNHVDTLGRLMRKVIAEQRREEGEDVDEDDEDDDDQEPIDSMTRVLVLSIGVCYHAKLQHRRQDYRKVVAQSFKAPCLLPGGEKQILREISSCQRAVLNELKLGPNIARNTALSENVFMMVVCIELRIPLFVVGKPGSSKSLAKTVVADNMQGDAARSELFKIFKQVHMASYQCSPLSTPEGIVATFRQCSKLQEGKNPERFVSVVVLDEVGLAEDSPLMPLKTLHPLLEDGVTSSDEVIKTDEKPRRVAFIGISNWALDPAKMNRGIMLSRGVPDVNELIQSALGICSTDERIKHLIQTLIPPLADGYAELYIEQKHFQTLKKCGKEEFFGLRDFYSLIKMVYAIAAKSSQRPRWHQLEHAIRRNFGGLTEQKPVEIFKRQFPDKDEDGEAKTSTTIRLIEASLGREDVADQANFSENRYLLILTENYAALRIMQQHLLKTSDDAVVIFGSSFPNDQEYTQICRNINRIKVCMETGRTVILLNLESLYESLYDALNQYYVYLGGQKYVDLGLGTHRLKCRVHDDFKLIVIAEKDVVYNSYPIPLINRLEKHFLVTSTSLTAEQLEFVEKLRIWADEFANATGASNHSKAFSIGDAFVGFHEDTIPSIVIQVCNDLQEEGNALHDGPEDPWEIKVTRRCKNMLLEMATPDAIARLPASGLKDEARAIWDIYFHEQQHSSLAAFMSHLLKSDDINFAKRKQEGLLVQITTHSRLLSKNDLADLCKQTGFHSSTVDFMTLQQFQTEQQFRSSVRTFFEDLGGECPGILIIQCDSGDDNFNLIAGARHILTEERKNAPELLNLRKIEAVHIALVVQLPRICGGCRNFVGFQGGKWISTHIDELRPPGKNVPSIEQLIDKPISELFGSGNESQPDMDVSRQMLAVNLLRNCVQAATCRVDDEAGAPERSTKRIEILLQCLPGDCESLEGDVTFSRVLVQRTYLLLKESERNAFNAYNAKEWLYSEALSGTGVQEWGTFRKALWKRVYSTVVPILAEIIALADRDSNLDLLRDTSSWVSMVWLKILANPNISELSYSMIISPVTTSVRERVQVLGSGAGGHIFPCKFPFSSLVKPRVDQLLKDALSVAASLSESVVTSLRTQINNSDVGPVLGELRHRLQYFLALAYLSDFVHMTYKSSSPSQHELVCEAILSSARELGVEQDGDGNELVDVALIHLAHYRIQSRLRCFGKLVLAQPSVVGRLKETFGDKESEVLLDVVALLICLDEMSPSDEVLLGPDTRRIWCDKVLSIRRAVDDMMRKELFQSVSEKTSNYGVKAKELIDRCRSIWQRAGAVRLFVEHVTLCDERDDGLNPESVVLLWKALGDETDFSSLTSLQTIDKFLISYSEKVQKRDGEGIVSELRRRCNAFFMELVSLFCFGESSKDLQLDALSHLMRYVIGQQSTQTKDFSPFPDSRIDPTPVVRSFLLQQLLRSSSALVEEHLDVFLQDARSLNPDPQHVKEVCFLCVQCMEDTLISRYKAKNVDSKLTVKFKLAKKICDQVLTAVKDVAAANDMPFEMNANFLESVAKGRYVLTLLADSLYKIFIEGDISYSDNHDAQRDLRSLLESAKRLCIECSSTTPQLFHVKQLVRRYGFDCVRTLASYQELEWIVPAEALLQNEDVIPDRYVVHEDQYRDIREGLAKAVISGNIQDLKTAVEKSKVKGVYKDVLLLLVFYQEITMANASSQRQNVSKKVKENLAKFVQNGRVLSSKAQPFARQLLENSQGGQFTGLKVFPGKSPQDHTLAEIVIHTSVALQLVGSRSLARPLYTLMMDSSSLTNSYLPTIPEDNFLECIKVIAETMEETGLTGQWYECANCKHPYFIGECSKPMENIPCPDCGNVLGGEEHRFLGGERLSDRQDRTKKGHALGEPSSRPTIAEPQRNLSPIVCSLLRIVMHSAMVMGACRDAKATSQVITPPCEPEHAAAFLWQHLQRDLDVLGRALGRSVDDAALTVHLVLRRMILVNGGQTANAHNMRLETRDSRRQWETDFSDVVISPIVRQLDQNLQKASKLVMEDERFGSDPLVRQLYEFEEQTEDLSVGLGPMSRSLWKYRRQITVENVGNSFQQETQSDGETQYKVLSAFLKQEHKLRAVQFLPDIVRLQRLLMDKFHRRIDRTDAEQFTIQKFLHDLPRGPVREEYSGLIQRFKIAWNSCRSFLGDQGRLRVPQDLCNATMDNNCPIAMLLPSTKGMGICSVSLLYFLVNTHNEFLGTSRSKSNQDSPLERVSITDVTMSHLIAYDPEKDLLPLILAHCNYSLEVGQETLVQYDWAALERQLIDRFLRGRPFVEFKEERFAFSRDTRDDTLFASLANKIPQEAISRVIEGQIISEFRSSLSDVCDVLSSLDIAIGFLASSGGQTDRPLRWYLHEVLRLPTDRGLKSLTAEQHCNLSHTLALWRLMALEKAKIKSRNKQEPFEEMPDVFKDKLSSSVLAHLNRVLRKIDMDQFMPYLLEMILLKVKHDDKNVATMSFKEYLELYLAEKNYEQIPGTENIPDEVTMAHLQAVWNSAVKLSDDFRSGSQSAAA